MTQTEKQATLAKIATLIWQSDDEVERGALKLEYDYWLSR